jgi:predicted nucleic acid-binding Zn ribbon protein
VRRCETCDEPVDGRTDQKFCSSRCRVAAHRARHRRAASDWRVAAAQLELGWPETWGQSRDDARVLDVFGEIENSIAALVDEAPTACARRRNLSEVASGSIWATTRGRSRVDAESGPPSVRPEPPEGEASLVSQGVRSTSRPPTMTIDDWCRGRADVSEIEGTIE